MSCRASTNKSAICLSASVSVFRRLLLKDTGITSDTAWSRERYSRRARRAMATRGEPLRVRQRHLPAWKTQSPFRDGTSLPRDETSRLSSFPRPVSLPATPGWLFLLLNTRKSHVFSKMHAEVASSRKPSQSALCPSMLILTSEPESADLPLSALPLPSVAHDPVFEIRERALVFLRKAPPQIPVSPRH